MSHPRILLDAASFMDSPQSAAIDIDQENAREIVRRFLSACYVDLGQAPKHLDGQGFKQVLLEALPRRYGKGDPLAGSTEAVLSAYLDHLADSEVVTAIFELRHALLEHALEFCEQVKRGDAHQDGIAKLESTTVKHRATKVGRNDPCPCGSGKKFKKCCQSSGE